jgi:tRNA(adenine34) deaminase
MHARVEHVVFGAYDPKTGVCGSSENLINAKCFNHKINLVSGVLENESRQLLKNFFNSRR